MFVQNVALPAVPHYARIAPSVLTDVLTRIVAEPALLTVALDDGFRTMEDAQPHLAAYLADELAEIDDAHLSAIGYFLSVLVYLAFAQAFGSRLFPLQRQDISQTLDRLVADGELRSGGAAGSSYSEDAIALGQPALTALLRSEIDRAIADAPEHASFARVDMVYEALLVELLVLTYAVVPA